MPNIISFSNLDINTPQSPENVTLNAQDSFTLSMKKYAENHDLSFCTIYFNAQSITKQVKYNDIDYYLMKRNGFFSDMQKTLKLTKNTEIFVVNNIDQLSIILTIINKLKRKKNILFIHNQWQLNNFPIAFRYKILLFMSLVPNVIIFNTNNQIDTFPSHIRKKSIKFNWGIIPNMKPIKKTNTLNILYVGRIFPDKKIDEIARGLALSKNKKNIKFHIAGGVLDQDKKYLNYILSILKKNGIPFIHHGFVDESKLIELYNKSDIFINLRENEGFGRVFIEAMNYYNIIIGKCNSFGPEELICDFKNGFLIKNHREIGDIIDHLYENQNVLRKMQQYSNKFVRDRYSYDESYISFCKIDRFVRD